MRESYLSYAMSVIASRALPDVRDGLKPVQRRILYAMREMGMTPDKQHRKSAGVIGEVLKSYHPHGDSSVYDALVRMAQDFSLRYPLIDGHGNFGSIDPNPPAAYRYTEARLGRLVDGPLVRHRQRHGPISFPTSTGRPKNRVVLPGRLPQLLVNGSSGIAVGMATNIPPHNISEICDAVDEAHRRAGRRRRRGDRHRQRSRFPDRRRAAWTRSDRQAYKTGRGSVAVRGRAETSRKKASSASRSPSCPTRSTIERVELGDQGRLSREAHHRHPSDLNDLSNRHGMKIVVDLQRTAVPNVVLNQLYKQTPLQSLFAFNMLALVPVLNRDGSRASKNLARAASALAAGEMLGISSPIARTSSRRRRLVPICARPKSARTCSKASASPSTTSTKSSTIVRESDTVERARQSLSSRFGLTDIQANAIVDMRLRTLTGLERQKIEDEYAQLLKTIAELQDILASERRQLGVVRTETEDVKKRLGDARKTPVEALEGELAIEDIIEDTEVVVTVTVGGYIKRVSVDTFRAQNRGGRGVIGISNLKKRRRRPELLRGDDAPARAVLHE